MAKKKKKKKGKTKATQGAKVGSSKLKATILARKTKKANRTKPALGR